MAINERLIHTAADAAAGAGTGNQEDGLVLHLDANDVDSYDGDGSIWYDIKDHEYTTSIDIDSNFKVLNWNGNGTSQDIPTGFKADFFFAACTTVSSAKIVQDSVRGINQYWEAAPGDSNDFQTASNFVTAFNSDSISIGNGSEVNFNARNFRGLALKAGDEEVINNDGTQQTTVSVNTDIGFSIVKGTGRLYDKTFGHGLGVKPKLFILKQDGSAQALMHHAEAGGYFEMNNGGYQASSSSVVNTNLASSFSGYSLSVSDTTLYCFEEKRGFSRFGTYTGTGAAGNKVYCGFEPAFVIVRKLAPGTTNGFFMFDNLVNTNNPRTKYQHFARSGTFITDSAGIDFNGDGFTVNSTNTVLNGSGSNFMFIAFAKNTNETSLIPDTDLALHLDAASFDGSTNTPTTWTALTGNNGTITGGALFDGELGNWLDLDGSDDKIDIGNISAFNTTNSFTLEFWENRDDTNENCLAAKGSYPSNAGWFFSYSNAYGYYFLDYGTGSYIRAGSAYSAGQWRHIVLTWDASTKTPNLFVNGEDVSATVNIGTGTGTNNTVSMQIGNGSGRAGVQAGFDGKLGQVRGYSTALTQDQIRQNFNFTKNDYPNGLDVAKYGATFDPSTHTNPDVDAFSFDGTNDYFDNNTFNTMLGGSSYTLSAWIYVQGSLSGSGAYVIMSTIQSGSGLQLDIIKSNGNLRLYHSGGTAVNQQSSSSISTNTWYHVICVRDRVLGKVNFFIDGIASGSSSITGANGSSNGTGFEIGRYNNGYYFNGDIAQVKVFNKAMTTAEAEALFNQNATTFGKTEV